MMFGERHGRLIALYRLEEECGYHRYWAFLCDCGNRTVALANNVSRGKTASCGCLKRPHGHASTNQMSPTYVSWHGAKQRCYDQNSKDYPHYGGRGITMCERWRDSFEAFLEDMGERPEGSSIERIDNDGNYEPGNCRWATRREQARNRRRP